jgi:putative sigma-54 modulation protein
MQTSVTFKNIKPSNHLKAFLDSKLSRLDKLLDNPAEASAVLTVEKFRHIAEINIQGDRLNINGREETSDMYAAIDMVLDKIESQIKKSKEKTRARRGVGRVKEINTLADEEIDADDDPVREIHVKNIEYKPMDVEEATLQLELIKKSFLVFTNARTNRVNVLYRRKDGHFGLIQPRRS